MFGKKIAQALDSTAAKAHEAGRKVAGDTGGKAADAAMGAVFGGIRSRIDIGCTRPGCDHSHDN